MHCFCSPTNMNQKFKLFLSLGLFLFEISISSSRSVLLFLIGDQVVKSKLCSFYSMQGNDEWVFSGPSGSVIGS